MSTTSRKRARPRGDAGSFTVEQDDAPIATGPPRHGGDELLVRLADTELEAVRINGVWLSPGGEQAYVAKGDAEALINAGTAEAA